MDESRILFPLRTNVSLFKTPEGYLELEERLKIASLLYDRLVLQSGFYFLQAAETVAYEIHERDISDDGAAKRREYFEKLDKQDPPPEFYLAWGGADDASKVAFTGQTQTLYFAEFQSLARQAGIAGQPWVELSGAEFSKDSPSDKWIQQQDLQDKNALHLGDEFGSDSVKPKIVHALNHDLALSAALGATLSTDPLHLALVEMKLERLGLVLSSHSIVVRAGLPAVKSVPWNEIIDLRGEPGMADFRRVVNEIESEVSTELETESSELFRDEIVKRWNAKVADVVHGLQPSLKQLTVESLKGLVLDYVPLPGLGTLIDTIRGFGEWHRERRSWINVYMRIVKRS